MANSMWGSFMRCERPGEPQRRTYLLKSAMENITLKIKDDTVTAEEYKTAFESLSNESKGLNAQHHWN